MEATANVIVNAARLHLVQCMQAHTECPLYFLIIFTPLHASNSVNAMTHPQPSQCMIGEEEGEVDRGRKFGALASVKPTHMIVEAAGERLQLLGSDAIHVE